MAASKKKISASQSLKLPTPLLNEVRSRKKVTNVPLSAFCATAIQRRLEFTDPENGMYLMEFIRQRSTSAKSAKEIFDLFAK